ncbi:response regulator [Streptomyces zaomyceticus]|uniref:response regulator n=1 Tax=Streptomyces zaomyceticus TaxID=68286 RepID=UPI0037B9BB62
MSQVLVVEDDPRLVRTLTINLKARNHEVAVAAGGVAALRIAADAPPDVILLDLGLPDMDGIHVIKELRRWSRVPIVVVSARRTSDEEIAALDAGADDYVTKPFDMNELLARLTTAVRRRETTGPAADEVQVVTTDDFSVDLAAKKVRRAAHDVRLTPTEWHLLETLIRNPGRLVSQRQLLEEVWGQHAGDRTNYLRVYMAHLRRKLEPDPSQPRHFITQPGMGYRFEA